MNNREFSAMLRSALQQVTAKSTERLMTIAATVGSAIRLALHFKSAEAAMEAGLARQLHFLLHESPGDSPIQRLQLAVAWAHHSLPGTEASVKLDKAIAEILEACLASP